MNLRGTRRRLPVAVDLTPMIDVVFLLLIFFMVSTTFNVAASLKLDLPRSHTRAAEQPPKQLVISIDARGRLFVQREPVADQDLKRRILNVTRGSKSLPVVLRADADARHKRVVFVMDVLQQLGLTRVGIATVPTEQE
ncbi:MAG: biopolymer transporter ExbD [Zetaproteobacteria bacterium]|nr:MAG: biopolymer transporter ExbD [Zetaproteobacteria bacterium]